MATGVKICHLNEQIPWMNHVEEKFSNSYMEARTAALDFIAETRDVHHSIAANLMADVFGSREIVREQGLEDSELADNLLLFHALTIAVFERSPVKVPYE